MNKKKSNKKGNPIPIEVKKVTDNKNARKARKIGNVKPIIVASLSAIIIGSILGLVMLNMFTNINDNQSSASLQLDKDDPKTDVVEDNIVKLEQMNAQVLQVGVFSEEANAMEWTEVYEQAGFPITVWEREGQYFLLAGIGAVKEQALSLAAELQQKSFDVYVKEWVTDELNVNLTPDEHKWVQSFQTQWKKSLDNPVDSLVGWNELLEDTPKRNEVILPLIETVRLISDVIETGDKKVVQHMILNMWQRYEEVLITK